MKCLDHSDLATAIPPINTNEYFEYPQNSFETFFSLHIYAYILFIKYKFKLVYTHADTFPIVLFRSVVFCKLLGLH